MLRNVLDAALMPLTSALAHARPLSPPDEANAERTEAMCRLSAREQSLTGKALDSSVQRCVAQISPNLGYWEHCRESARHRHLKRLALRDDVNACMSREP